MSIIKKVGRLLKLGVFVGAGAAVALVAACSSSAKRVDTGVPADGARDRGALDAGSHDAAPPDAGAPQDSGSRDLRAWDIPLE